MKFNDANGNGILDAGESGIAGLGNQRYKGSTVKQTTTAANGTYSFTFTQAELGTWVLTESLKVDGNKQPPSAEITQSQRCQQQILRILTLGIYS